LSNSTNDTGNLVCIMSCRTS